MTDCRFLLAIVAAGFLILPLGCSRADRNADISNSKLPDAVEIESEFEILIQLASTNRNTVHVALWTIQNNDIETPKEIDFDTPYKSNEAFLKSLADDLAKRDAPDLKELDKSLAYHWQIYSPIWGPSPENWE